MTSAPKSFSSTAECFGFSARQVRSGLFPAGSNATFLRTSGCLELLGLIFCARGLTWGWGPEAVSAHANAAAKRRRAAFSATPKLLEGDKVLIHAGLGTEVEVEIQPCIHHIKGLCGSVQIPGNYSRPPPRAQANLMNSNSEEPSGCRF